MENTIFRVHKRLSSFWKDDKSGYIQSPRFIITTVAWFLSFLMTGITVQYGLDYWQVWVSLALVSWFLVNHDVFRKLNPPTELIILVFISFYAIEIALYKLGFDPQTLIFTTGILLTILQLVTLAFMILLFGFILIDNSNGQQVVLIFYIFLGVLAHYFVLFNDTYLLLLFQIILFLSLFKRTTWLEKLTRAELWLYLVFFVALFYFHGTLPISELNSRHRSEAGLVWMSVPLYLSTLYRLYLLAMIVKAPVILIYNHAALARKLRMSALFQSTVPQFIQFILLLVIFFLFISGWQAQNIRMAIYRHVEQTAASEGRSEITCYKIPVTEETGGLVQVPGCYPQSIGPVTASMGIVTFRCHDSEEQSAPAGFVPYLLSRESKGNAPYLLLIRIDESFLKAITENLSFLAGGTIYAYTHTPSEYQARIYDLDFWQKSDRIKIYPFVLSTDIPSGAAEFRMKDFPPVEKSDYENIIDNVLGNLRLVTGRLFIPVLNTGQSSRVFLIDLIAPLQAQSLSSPMIRMFLLLGGLYFLFNMFVLQRVIQFGEQINRTIVKKFNQLQAGIREISTGNLDYQVTIEGEDEFAELAERFNYMRKQLKNSIEESREKERLNQELKIAREVQFSFLPSQLPDVPGYLVDASLRTANEVSGDFYDLIRLNTHTYVFTIGDVSGKGSSAAFYMAQVMSLLRFSLQFTSRPDEIALRINQYFTKHATDRQVFITAIIGVLDLKKNVVRLVRAGHTLPIRIPRDPALPVSEFKLSGMAIGLTASDALFKKELKLEEIRLDQGDMLLLYTDGITEAMIEEGNGAEAIYGEERLKRFLESVRSMNMDRIHQLLIGDLEKFYGGHPRMDDQTILILQKSTSPSGIPET